jgi:hypothetical protein
LIAAAFLPPAGFPFGELVDFPAGAFFFGAAGAVLVLFFGVAPFFTAMGLTSLQDILT